MKKLSVLLVMVGIIIAFGSCGITEKDLEPLRKKIDEMEAQIRYNRDLLEGTTKEFITWITYAWGEGVDIDMVLYNPLVKAQAKPIRVDLPKESQPRHIEDILLIVFDEETGKEGFVSIKGLIYQQMQEKYGLEEYSLRVGYDVSKEVYYVYYPEPKGYPFKPAEKKRYKIVLKDIWNIHKSEITIRREETQWLLKQLKNTPDYDRAKSKVILIEVELDFIWDQQKKNAQVPAMPEHHIFAYRDNLERLKRVNLLIDSLRK